MYIALGKNWELEINWSYWCPLDHLAFKKSLDIHFRDPDSDEYEPSLYFNFTFICFSIEFFLGRENTNDYD